jgi:hypothetical protein
MWWKHHRTTFPPQCPHYLEGIHWSFSGSLHSTWSDRNKAWIISSTESRHQDCDIVSTCIQQSKPLCHWHGEYWCQKDW